MAGRRKTKGAHTDTLKISRMRGETKPILIEVWNSAGRKSAVRTDAPGARHVAALLLKHATDIERELPITEDGYERVRKDDDNVE